MCGRAGFKPPTKPRRAHFISLGLSKASRRALRSLEIPILASLMAFQRLGPTSPLSTPFELDSGRTFLNDNVTVTLRAHPFLGLPPTTT